MRAAIYARKSTDQHISDDARSVARQVAHAREYAARKGWDVVESCVFVDDGISGAEFATRPAFLRLMNALKPPVPFDVLVMSEESRLGREAIETAYALKRLIVAGVRVFFYLDDRERTLDSPVEKAMLALQTMADEMEREKARQRTYDALRAKAQRGHVTGGRVFGYRNVRRDHHVEREIDETEAAVVRRIFELAAMGTGLTTIAKSLNQEAAPSPRAQQGRPAGWAPSSVRAVLHRPLYRGRVVWNRTKKRDRWGIRETARRPADQWITQEIAALRIVDESLWHAAHRALADQRARYHKPTPSWGREPKYLFTGLLRCGVCGGGMEVRTRSHGSQRRAFYGCAVNHRRGPTVCANYLTMPLEIVDRGILDAMLGQLVTPRILERVLRRARELLAATPDDSPLRDEDAALASEIGHLTEAIARGGDLAPLLEALRSREARRQEIADTRRALAAPSHPFDAQAARRELHDWQAVLRDGTHRARTALRQLVVGRITLQPRETAYAFEGVGTLDPIVGLLHQMASPTGRALMSHLDFRGLLRRPAA